jgi:hypothetical protein
MSLGIVDLNNFDLTIVSAQFGNITLRTYGEAGISAQVEALDTNLYNEKIGAFGDLMVSKNFKGVNKLLTVQILRNTADYAALQAIIAAEEAGQSILVAVNARDSFTEESYTSPVGVFKNIPNYQMGTDVDADVEFTVLMSSVIHEPPKASLNIVSI